MVPYPVLIRDNKLQTETIKKEVINISASASRY